MIKINNNSDYFFVSNDFVDKYLCEANGSFVKVYLYLLRHSKNPELTMSDIANALNLLESDVIRAFKYWSKQGIFQYEKLSDSDYTVDFVKENLPNTQAQKTSVQKPVVTTTAPTLVNYTKNDINTYMRNNEGIRHMFMISEQLLNRTLTETDRKILFGFYDYLELPVEVIFTLLEHCISNGKSNMRYIEKVAYSWADKGINTLTKASIAVKEENEINSMFRKYKTMFKISGRDFTSTEESYIKSWVSELKVPDSVIEAAYEKTVANTGKVVFKYMDAIIRNPSDISDKKTTSSNSAVQKGKRNFFQDYDADISDFDVQLINDLVNNN